MKELCLEKGKISWIVVIKIIKVNACVEVMMDDHMEERVKEVLDNEIL